MGLDVGKFVGLFVGKRVGRLVGKFVGLGVGLFVGSSVGSGVPQSPFPGGSSDSSQTVFCIQSYPIETREYTPGIKAHPMPQLTTPTCTSDCAPLFPRVIRGPPESP